MRTILILSIILIGCSSLKQPKDNSSKKVCMDNLKNILKENWKLSDDSIYYETNYKFLTNLDTAYDQCFNMLYQNEIIYLFGIPTETHKMKEGYHIQSSFNYLVSLPCKGRSTEDSQCDYFVFYFDSDLKVIKSIMETKASIRSH